MKRIIVQLYEIQEPREAEWLVELGVDHIGSVILSPEAWKIPVLRDVVRLVRQSPAKSTLIPLLTKPDDILRALDYYQPDFVHFCELIPLAPEEGGRREELCAELAGIQELVKREFPPLGIIRSIPIPEAGLADPAPVREAILAVAQILEPHSDYFMTDTLRGVGNGVVSQPVAGFVGITGEACDWELAKALVAASPIPVILAGGISPGNVFDAIARVGPAGIDSCTQTNTRDALGTPIRFRKDRERVRRLLDEVRRAEEARAEALRSESLPPDGCEPPGNR
jgi:phosphoribosylanthranilate isomerase